MEILEENIFKKIKTEKRWLSITDSGNIQKKYFKGYQIIYIFVQYMMLSAHVVFNIPFDLMYEICFFVR